MFCTSLCNTRQTRWSVILRLSHWTHLEYWHHECWRPLIRRFNTCEWLYGDGCEHRGKQGIGAAILLWSSTLALTVPSRLHFKCCFVDIYVLIIQDVSLAVDITMKLFLVFKWCDPWTIFLIWIGAIWDGETVYARLLTSHANSIIIWDQLNPCSILISR